MIIDCEVKALVESLCATVEERCLRYALDMDRATVIAWDTETTSLNGVIVQIGVVALDENGDELLADSRIIAPIYGHAVEERALAVHGISDNRRVREGESATACIRAFGELVRLACEKSVPLVAHNSSFDERMLRNTCAAVGVDAPTFQGFCTMTNGRRAMRELRGTNKRPKNVELYEALCGMLPPDTPLHDAVADAKLTARSYIEGHRRGFW